MAANYTKGAPAASKILSKSKSATLGKYNRPTSKEAQVQNVKAARLYIFGNDNVEEDDETVEFEMPEMRSRHNKGNMSLNLTCEDEKEDAHYFEKEINEGETLQAIALKYACPVSELKRLNNLIQDQEFYALKVLKVPMNKHGILSEQLAKGELTRHSKPAHESTSLFDSEQEMYKSNNEESDSQHDFSDPDTQMKVLRTLSIRENFSTQGKEAEKFLRKMDFDLNRLKQSSSSRSERESLSEVISVLTNKSIQPLRNNSRKNIHNGADCGISFRTILIIFIAVAVIFPLMFAFYFYYYEKS